MGKDKRIERLVEILLTHKNEYLSAQEIADALEISPRSVHTYLESEEFVALTEPITLSKIPNKGIRLEVDNAQVNSIYDKIYKRNRRSLIFKFGENNTLEELMKLLFLAPSPLTYDNLSEKLFVSKTPLLSFLSTFEEWLLPYRVTIERKENTGISLKGDEIQIRKAFRVFCMDGVAPGTSNIKTSRIFKDLRGVLEYIFGQTNIQNICNIIDLSEINLNDYFTDFDYSILVTKTAILVYRASIGKIVEPRKKFNSRTREFLISQVIKMNIDSSFNLDLHPNEVQELTRYLLSTRKQENITSTHDYIVNPENITDLIASLSTSLDADLTNDAELIKNLSSHLSLASRRYHYGIKLENPIIDRIRAEYPDVYIAIMTSIETFERNEGVGFDENEIGYICLHVVASLNRNQKGRHLNSLLICDSGMAFASYIKSEVESAFSEIDISQIINSSNMKSVTIDDFDLILSTTDIQDQSPDNFIIIDHMFASNDHDTVRTWLLKYEMTALASNEDEVRDNVFFYKDSGTDMHSVLRKYSTMLYNDGFVTEEFYDSIIQRESVASTSMGRGIAVPHGSNTFVRKSVVVVIHLDEPIDWDGVPVDLIFLIAINVESDSHKIFFKKLFHIISDNGKINKIKSSIKIEELEDLFFEL